MSYVQFDPHGDEIVYVRSDARLIAAEDEIKFGRSLSRYFRDVPSSLEMYYLHWASENTLFIKVHVGGQRPLDSFV